MAAKVIAGPGGGRDKDRSQDIGLFRYAMICKAADQSLTPRERGALVRALAGSEHVGPFGTPVRVSRQSLDRWIRVWRAGGFEALIPAPRAAVPHTEPAVLELAAALKREKPKRTSAQVRRILTESGSREAPSVRTLQRHFARLGLNITDSGPAKVFGRFEARSRNDRWIGDALHGPKIGGRKTYLFAFIDDHSRTLVGYRWFHSEDTYCLETALRAGISARGLPRVLYLDNGAAMVSKQLSRALAMLGIRLTHSRPGQPAGRGKIERFFRTVRDQFLVELSTPDALAQVTDLQMLNELFAAWVETVYHHSEHSETGDRPLARFLAAGPVHTPTPAKITEAFLWAHERKVTKTATISLFGNIYQVDEVLVGCTIEVVFDPLDMTELTVKYLDKTVGKAIGFQIRSHVHPNLATKKTEPATEPTPTGINYLKLVAENHQKSRYRQIRYANLSHQPDPDPDPDPADVPVSSNDPSGCELPGQLDLTEMIDPHAEGGQGK
jgi:putative transposase